MREALIRTRWITVDGVTMDRNIAKAAPLLYEALIHIREIIKDGALEGFNPMAGDWAERLFKSQHMSHEAVKKARGES
jgi:hypothetical protein